MSSQQAESAQPPSAKRARFEQREIKCVDDLYLKEKFADVWFSFGSNDGTVTRIPAHKLLLAVVSDVFEAMFFGGLKETGDIVITDASAEEFKAFSRYFYQREVNVTTDNVAGVMYLGHKYNVDGILDACVEHLKKNLTVENVCAALSLAILYDQNELKTICEKHVQSTTAMVFALTDFVDCSKEAMAHILQMNPLSCSEVNVFEVCMEWVRAKSQHNTVSKAMVQEHLGDLYYEIRYASMTSGEFCDLYVKYSDVLRDDFHDIVHLITKTNEKPGRFNTSLRQMEIPDEITWNSNQIIECNRESLSGIQQNELDAEVKTIFSANTPLILGSFECNAIWQKGDGLFDFASKLLIEIEITEARALNDIGVKIVKNMMNYLGSDTTTISLLQPILIRPNYFYTITIKGSPEHHYFESFKQQKSMTLVCGAEIQFYNDKIVQGGEIFGLIYGLNFNEIKKLKV